MRIKVPEADWAKTDVRSILSVVLNRKEDDFYILGIKTDILKQLYARSEFRVVISLRQTVIK